jgi:hypothetical protein
MKHNSKRYVDYLISGLEDWSGYKMPMANLPFQISSASSGWIKGDKPFYSIVLVRRSWCKTLFWNLGFDSLLRAFIYNKKSFGTPKGTIGRCPSATLKRSIYTTHNFVITEADLLKQSNHIGGCKILTKMWWAKIIEVHCKIIEVQIIEVDTLLCIPIQQTSCVCPHIYAW